MRVRSVYVCYFVLKFQAFGACRLLAPSSTARGHMGDEELSAALANLDETREAAERELEAVRERR